MQTNSFIIIFALETCVIRPKLGPIVYILGPARTEKKG